MIPKTVSRGLWLTPLLAALAGCNTVVLNPSADIAKQQAHLIIISVILMLLVIGLTVIQFRFVERKVRYQ